MKKTSLLIFFSCLFFASAAQKNSLYFYYGWNQSNFTTSNIHFEGADYDFTLYKVKAEDRQSKFALNPYFHPKYFTIPQYNFRLGYFLTDTWDISFGIDHMKYVMQSPQTVNIRGNILDSGSIYQGEFNGEAINLTHDFLLFEHTDGLNYLNIELRNNRHLLGNKKITLSGILGGGAGLLLTRTNTTLMNKERYDEFHISGFGVSAMAGLKFLFYNTFFIQTELKGGYMNLPSIRTTSRQTDKANQSFFCAEYAFVIGARFGLTRIAKKKKD